jgi:hypothetical protein
MSNFFENELTYHYVPTYFNLFTQEENKLFKELFDTPLLFYVNKVREFEYIELNDKQLKRCIELASLQDKFLDKLDLKYL